MNEPDLDQAQAFLDALEPGGKFTFQTFSESDEAKRRYVKGGRYGRDQLARKLHGTLSRHAKSLTGKNQSGAGVYVMVNQGDGKGRKAENVARVRAVFADFDSTSPDTAIQGEPQPHIVVQSGPHGVHTYWRVSDCGLGDFKRVQGQIATAFGSDPKPKDLPRVMRLPGFWHCKGEPFLSKLVNASDAAPYRLDELAFLRTATGAPLPQSGVGFAAMEAWWTDSENWRTMEPQARDLFAIALMFYNGRNNGDICLARGNMERYPAWHCRQKLSDWRQELVRRGWLLIARPGKPTRYALTVRAIDDVRWPGGVRKHDLPATTQPPNNWKLWRPDQTPMSATTDTAFREAA